MLVRRSQPKPLLLDPCRTHPPTVATVLVKAKLMAIAPQMKQPQAITWALSGGEKGQASKDGDGWGQ